MGFLRFLVCFELPYHTVIYYLTQYNPADCLFFFFFFLNLEGKLQVFT